MLSLPTRRVTRRSVLRAFSVDSTRVTTSAVASAEAARLSFAPSSTSGTTSVTAAAGEAPVRVVLDRSPEVQNLAPLSPVIIRTSEGAIVLTATADATGTVSVLGLAPGEYTIEMTDATGQTRVRVLKVLGTQVEN